MPGVSFRVASDPLLVKARSPERSFWKGRDRDVVYEGCHWALRPEPGQGFGDPTSTYVTDEETHRNDMKQLV